MKKYFAIIGYAICLLSIATAHSQSIYAGIEIGGKGVKVSVIKIIDIQVGEFEVVKTWTRNTNITKNIDKEGNLDKLDIDDTSYVILDLINQIKIEYRISEASIFLVASSSVALAPNRTVLSEKINLLTKKKLDFMTADVESRLTIKGSIPQRDYLNSMVLDIGSGSIKGGTIELEKNRTYTFSSFGTKFGVSNLTDKLASIIKNSDNKALSDNELQKVKDSIAVPLKVMFDNVPKARDKDNIYIIGGAAWAFVVLTKPDEKEAYQPFLQKDLIAYMNGLINNYDDFVKKEYINKDYERVIKTFSKENLIAGSLIMNQIAANVNKPSQKKFYFVRQGQVAWLIAYIVDAVREKK